MRLKCDSLSELMYYVFEVHHATRVERCVLIRGIWHVRF